LGTKVVQPVSSDDEFAYYVINLDHSEERWRRINEHLKSMHIEARRISAVYGADLFDEEIARYYTPALNQKQFFMPLKFAEIGCFLSHFKALEAFVHDTEKIYAIILEDDVEFIGNVQIYKHQWLDAVQGQDAKLLKLYSRRKIKGDLVYSQHGLKTLSPVLIPLGTQATLYNRHAALQLLSVYKKFGMPIDVAYQHWWQHGVKILVCETNQINEISAQIGGSNISNKHDHLLSFKIKRELKRSWYRFKLALMSVYYYYRASS
jgi:GR25 family glycosyltransferase involved in LPS biosynthesis